MAVENSGASRRRMYVRMVLRSLSRRRSRVVIALLAIAIGATTLTGLISIYTDIPRQMGRELRSYGANLVVIPDGKPVIDANVLPALDAAVGDGDGDLVGRAAYRYETVTINSQPVSAAGTDLDDVRAVRPYWQVSGAWPQAGEILVGRDVADQLGLATGESVTLAWSAGKKQGSDSDSTDEFTVSGVLDTGGSEDALVILERAGLEGLTGEVGAIDVVEYSVATSADQMSAIVTRITESTPGVAASPVKRLARSETTVLATLSSLLLLVTVIVLALTMITVATTMMAVVAERRAEIGLRKALGAENRSIIGEFLGEGMALGALGGLAGGIAGLGFAQVVSLNVFSRGIATDWTLVPIAVLASVAVTAVACIVPVRRAAYIEPAIVLRGE
ncbi:MAG: ABC transporter permease [Propionibacteriaceae bacterium]|nr:ABC transporter permease [Propionibacteriaceae bacterium]